MCSLKNDDDFRLNKTEMIIQLKTDELCVKTIVATQHTICGGGLRTQYTGSHRE